MKGRSTTPTSAVLKRAGTSTAILQVFAGLLLVILTVLLVEVWHRQTQLIDGIRENALWSAYQLDREATQLQAAISIALSKKRPVKADMRAMTIRYDILYARIKELRHSKFQDYFSLDPHIESGLSGLNEAIMGLAPTFDAIAAGALPGKADLAALMDAVQSVVKQSGAFVVYTNGASSTANAENRSRILEVQTTSAIMTGVLVISVIFLIATLRRQLNAVREAGLSLETMTTELTTAYEAADAGNRAKSQFMATMGHEIRTPLNAILGMAELMQMSNLPEEEKANVHVIRASGEALLEILNEILDYSKIEHGSLQLEARPIELRSFVESTAAIIRGRAEEKGFDIAVVVPQTLSAPVVATDPTRLRQVLLNLLSNAVKFTDRGGVTLRLEERRDGDRLLACFEVTDSGIGIDAEGMEKLFKPFSQVDASISRKYGGTGLGLTICKQIIEKLGGTIGVRSTIGEGTTFHFELPVIAASLVESDAASSQLGPQGALKAHRVLLVEDNKVNQQVATRFLTRLGQTVTIAENGIEALEITGRDPFDIILMDMQMPVMDGIEATRQIFARGGLAASTPIVAMTANDSDSDRALCSEVGMVGFLSKPISMERLRNMLTSVLPASEMCPVLQAEKTDLNKALPEQASVLDMARRDELVDALGEEIYAELIESFFQDAGRLLEELRSATMMRDLKRADDTLHTIKGAASNIGLGNIAATASSLRKTDLAPETVATMEVSIEDARQLLAA